MGVCARAHCLAVGLKGGCVFFTVAGCRGGSEGRVEVSQGSRWRDPRNRKLRSLLFSLLLCGLADRKSVV